MDINAAYREVGTYRGAADICGTTPKTVKRVVEAAGCEPGVEPRTRRGVFCVRTVEFERWVQGAGVSARP